MKPNWISRMAAVAILATFACSASIAQQARFPSQPVKIVVGYPPGGGNDLIARAVGRRLGEIWGQPVVIENRAGASGTIGARHVAQSTPDGYTLLLTGSSHLIQAAVSPDQVPYRAVDDFSAVATVGTAPIVLLAHPSFPARNVQELIAAAKAEPGKILFGSAGIGTSPHIAGELFNQMAKVQLRHVPYKGSAPAQADLIGGQIQLVFQVTQTALPSVRANQVRALGVTSRTRHPALPDVPTIAESGLPDYEMSLWWGLLGPANMPQALRDAMSTAVRQALTDAEVRKQLEAAGLTVAGSTSEEMLKVMRRDLQTYTKLVQDAGIKAQ